MSTDSMNVSFALAACGAARDGTETPDKSVLVAHTVITAAKVKQLSNV